MKNFWCSLLHTITGTLVRSTREVPTLVDGYQYQKIIGGSGGRNPKTGEVEDDPSSDSGEGNGKTVQHGCGGVTHSSYRAVDRASSQPSITIHHHNLAQTAPTTQKRRTIYLLQRCQRKKVWI